VLAAAGGCGQRHPPDMVQPGPPPGLVAPSWAEVVAKQNERVLRFQDFFMSGQAELRWTDDRVHFEYCRIELFWRPPSWTGVSLTKAGERFLWLGSDPERYWVFELSINPTRLTIGRHAETGDGANAPLGIRPLALLDLMGLGQFPSQGEETVWWSDEDNRWAVMSEGPTGRFEIHVDPATLLPLRTYLLDSERNRQIVCDLSDYETVQTEGVGPGGTPQCPTKVSLRRLGTDDRIDLHFSEPKGKSTLVKDGLFDIERLRRLMKPAVVVDHDVVDSATTTPGAGS
jgi:hypothetical protein